MDLLIQSIVPDPSFLRESEEAVQRSAKQIKWVEKVCAQLAKDRLSAVIQKEEEDEEGYKDIVEHTKIVTESSRDDHDQECPAVADHAFPLHLKF
ncbi:unnamed protein product [Linum trigynum]|uniref:Uncharacterized protein n=1 Tax=Linum trigynum TaxID=586398 RepID=A0AAV2EAU7_9ROSI